MREAARTLAVIELLELIDGGLAADRAVADYFRARRYAGSKDRAAVAGRLFDILRRKAELLWRLGETAGPRLLALGARVAFDGWTPDAALAECDGGAHAPPPPDDETRARIAALATPAPEPPPDWVRGGYPRWIEPELRRRFGEGLVEELAALLVRAPVDLRVNRLKATRETALARLAEAGVMATPTPLSPLGLRLADRARIEGLEIFRDGWIEPQDEGSQLAVLLTGARPDETVVDLCAGAGGKTLALAAEMGGRGRLIACDVDGGRLKRMAPRVERAGARVEVRRLSPGGEAAALADLAGRCDRVLIDAPCSGTGTWRRQPELRWRLSPESLAADCAIQARLLDLAAGLVRPGGRLVYVTCSLLPAENEDRIAAFLAGHPGWTVEPAAGLCPDLLGRAVPGAGDVLRLSPRSDGTDGFFVARLRPPE